MLGLARLFCCVNLVLVVEGSGFDLVFLLHRQFQEVEAQDLSLEETWAPLPTCFLLNSNGFLDCLSYEDVSHLALS